MNNARKCWTYTINNYQADDGMDPSLCDYLIEAHEMGEDGTPHIQGYVVLTTKDRFSAMKKRLPRAHIEPSNGTPYQNFLYCTKGEQSKQEWADLKELGPNFGLNAHFLEWGTRPNAPGPSHKKKPKDTTYAEVIQASTPKEGLEILKAKRPRDYVMHYDTIERHLKRQKVEKRVRKYNADDFNHPLLTFEKSILLCGPTGYGKTQFALAHFENPLLVRQIDRLKTFDAAVHDGIVFDDMSFLHRPAEGIIHMLDVQEDSDVYARYGNAFIPANTPRIFTHNTENPFYSMDIPQEQKDAIERRVDRIILHAPLFSRRNEAFIE